MAEILEGKDFIKSGFLDEEIKKLNTIIEKTKELGEVNKKNAKDLEASAKKISPSSKGASKQITEAEKQTEKLVKAQKKYDTSLEETEKELVKVKLAQQQLNQVNKLTEKLNKSAEGSYNKLSAQYSINKIKLNSLSEAELKTSKSSQKLTKDTERLYQRMNTFQKSTGKAQLQVGQYSRGLRGAITATKSLVSAMGLMGGAFVVVSIIRNAVKTIVDFDKEMTNLAAIIGINRSEMPKLSAVIRQVARDSVNTATDIAKMATALITLGKTKKEVAGLIKPVNNLSIALNATAEESGELLVKTLNAFGESSKEAQNYADVIAKMRISTALDFEQIKDSLGFVAPTASALGLTFEQTASRLGVLVDNGIKGARAGRLLSSSFARLNAKGLSLDEALAKINGSINKTKTATELFGVQSFTLGLILAKNGEKIKEYDESFQDVSGTLQRLTDDQLQSMSAKVAILNSTWKELLITIESGEGAVADFIGGAITKLTSALRVLTNLDLAFDFFTTRIKNLSDQQIGDIIDTGLISAGDKSLKELFSTLESENIEKILSNVDKFKKEIVAAFVAEGESAEDATIIFNGWLRNKKSAYDSAVKAQNNYNFALSKGVSTFKEFKDKYGESIEAFENGNLVLDNVKNLYEDATIAAKKLSKEVEDAANKAKESLDKIKKAREDDAKQLAKLAEIEQKRLDDEQKRLDKIESTNSKRHKKTMSLALDQINQTHELRLSEIDLLKTTEEEKTRLVLEAEQKRMQAILRMQKLFGVTLSDIQIQILENQIAKINQKLEESASQSGGKDIFSILGINLNDEDKERIGESFNFIRQGISDIMSVREQSANQAVEISERDLETAESHLEEQQALRDRGEVSDVARAERNLNKEKQINEKAIKIAEKASKQRERIATAETLSSLILASANIFAGFKGAGPLQVFLGTAAVALMLGSFIAAKSSAKKASKSFGGGGSFDVGGGSHSSGNDTSLGIHGGTEMKVERNEKVGIISAKSMSKYGGGYVDSVIDSLNNQDFENKYGQTFVGFDKMPSYVINTTQDNNDMKNFHRNENDNMMRNFSNSIKDIPQPIWNITNGKLVQSVKKGNQTYVDIEQQIKG